MAGRPQPHLLRLPHHPSPPGSTPHFFVLKAPPPPRGFSPGGQAVTGGGASTRGPRPPFSPDPSPVLTSHLPFPPRCDPRGASSLAGHQREAGNWRGKLSRQGAQRPTHIRPGRAARPLPREPRLSPAPPRHSSLTFSQPFGNPTPAPPLPPCPLSALFMFQPSDLHRPRLWP